MIDDLVFEVNFSGSLAVLEYYCHHYSNIDHFLSYRVMYLPASSARQSRQTRCQYHDSGTKEMFVHGLFIIFFPKAGDRYFHSNNSVAPRRKNCAEMLVPKWRWTCSGTLLKAGYHRNMPMPVSGAARLINPEVWDDKHIQLAACSITAKGFGPLASA